MRTKINFCVVINAASLQFNFLTFFHAIESLFNEVT